MIEKKFAYHTPSAEGLEKARKLREAFTALDSTVRELTPKSREQSVALTEIETAAMWAIKAVVLNDSASVAQE